MSAENAATLGYVVVELEKATGRPTSRESLFIWDGGSLFDAPEDAASEARDAARIHNSDRFDYRVAALTLVDV